MLMLRSLECPDSRIHLLHSVTRRCLLPLAPQGSKAAGGKKAAAAAADSEDDDAAHCGGNECCSDEECGQGHSLSSGAGDQRPNPVAAMPGLVFEPKVAKSVVAFMAADSPDKVCVCVCVCLTVCTVC